jgi:hypothetical protein
VRAGNVGVYELVGGEVERTEDYIYMHDIDIDTRDQKGAGPKLGLRAMLPFSVSIFYCTVKQNRRRHCENSDVF